MENELKVGDKVIFLLHINDYDPWENMYGIQVGGIYEITEIKRDMVHIGEVGWKEYSGCWPYPDQIQKITGKETELEKLLLWRNYAG